MDRVSTTPVLELSGLRKSFPTPGGEFIAIDGIFLKIYPGEFVSIMGHSGCGKSTVLNLVAGLGAATQGAVLLDGREVTEPGPDRMVVFQNYSLLPWLTVEENVRLAVDAARDVRNGDLIFAAETETQRGERTRKYLDLVGLSQALAKFPSELSGGMKQRVSIARALVLEPRILILDEPFGALDAITREDMQDELLQIWSDSNTTGLMVTHEVDEAILLSDRIVMMTNGPAATIGEVFDVPFSRPRTREGLMESPEYYGLRNRIMEFLYEKFAHDDASDGTPHQRTESEP
jgi:nitrate/nitrite transport system ATP-binding protein